MYPYDVFVVHDPTVYLWQAAEDVDHESKDDGQVDLIVNFVFFSFVVYIEDMVLWNFVLW